VVLANACAMRVLCACEALAGREGHGEVGGGLAHKAGEVVHSAKHVVKVAQDKMVHSAEFVVRSVLPYKNEGRDGVGRPRTTGAGDVPSSTR